MKNRYGPSRRIVGICGHSLFHSGREDLDLRPALRAALAKLSYAREPALLRGPGARLQEAFAANGFLTGGVFFGVGQVPWAARGGILTLGRIVFCQASLEILRLPHLQAAVLLGAKDIDEERHTRGERI